MPIPDPTGNPVVEGVEKQQQNHTGPKLSESATRACPPAGEALVNVGQRESGGAGIWPDEHRSRSYTRVCRHWGLVLLMDRCLTSVAHRVVQVGVVVVVVAVVVVFITFAVKQMVDPWCPR